MVSIKSKGSFSKTEIFLERALRGIDKNIIKRYAEKGLEALSFATPIDTGNTASSWSYQIATNKNSITIEYNNANIQNGIPIAILLQYGHATRNGGWVEGVDYINPALEPVFKALANELWKEVTG